jgi:hypothetical protein
MRSVVGIDEQGRYRPGTRVYGKDDEIRTAFDVKPQSTREGAIERSMEMLGHKLVDHARWAAESMQAAGEIVEVRLEPRAFAMAEGRVSGAAAKYGAQRESQEAMQEHGAKKTL